MNFKNNNLEKIKQSKLNCEKIGRMIYFLRKSKGWSLERLGLESGVTHQLIDRYEKGKHISIERLEQIASAFEMNIFEFIKKCEI